MLLERIVGIALILIVLWEAFETMVLPQRTASKFRLTRLFYQRAWYPWKLASRAIRSTGLRETFLSTFGPLSAILLLMCWAAVLIFGFTLIYLSLPGGIRFTGSSSGFEEYLYYSGSMFFTIGAAEDYAIATSAAADRGRGWNFSRTGSVGRPNCSNRICRIRCSDIFDRSITINPGWPRWSRCSIHADG